MKSPLDRLCATLAGLLAAGAAQAADPQRIPVTVLSAPPEVDGDLAEWGKTGWLKVAVAPTVKPEERAGLGLSAEDRNSTGKITVELKAGVKNNRFYFAARWPDDAPDTDLDVWVWNGSRYARSRRFDDMFALRFHLAGDYDRSMLSGRNYEADVWLWLAGRSNPLGIAEDYRHVISTRMIENAAEYTVKGVGTIYIKKHRDAGAISYRTRRPPREKAEDELPAIELVGDADGSFADVSAKGAWRNGFWQLEMSRALNTGHDDDVVLPAGGSATGQIAVFNHAGAENKSVSEPLLFDFSAIK